MNSQRTAKDCWSLADRGTLLNRSQTLQPFLERVYRRYHLRERLSSDPLEFVHRWKTPREQEAVAILSALLAYGNVKQIRASAEALLDRLEFYGSGSLARALVRAAQPSEAPALSKALSGFVHRFNPSADWVLLFRLIASSQKEWGSVGAQLCAGLSPEHPDFSIALDAMIHQWWGQVVEWDPAAAKPGSSFRYLLNSPLQSGSACKRWCMLMRWMGRKDEIDVGLWQEFGLKPSQLVMPLDVHTGRMSQLLGLTERRSLNWKAAREITDRFAEIDPQDPVRFDFSLCRLGILKMCKNRFVQEICSQCDLVTVCRLAENAKPRSSRAPSRVKAQVPRVKAPGSPPVHLH